MLEEIMGAAKALVSDNEEQQIEGLDMLLTIVVMVAARRNVSREEVLKSLTAQVFAVALEDYNDFKGD